MEGRIAPRAQQVKVALRVGRCALHQPGSVLQRPAVCLHRRATIIQPALMLGI